MRAHLLSALILIAGQHLSAQAPNPNLQELPKDPRAILAAAQPLYDFNSVDLKPWHLKATYQLYDDTGKPAEQGIYEYWWASPKVYRSTWTRPGMTHSDWYTADGKHAYQASGATLNYFEYALKQAFLAPVPDTAALDIAHFRLDRQEVALADVKLPCVMVVPRMPLHGQLQIVPLGLFPTYCFDTRSPALRASYSFGMIGIAFDKIVMVQHRYIAKEIVFFEGKRKLLTATLDDVKGLAPNDPALMPPADAAFTTTDKAPIDGKVANGMLIKKPRPIYPQDAKDARVSGEVVLGATIGVDGAVHELHVIEAPWPSLVASAVWAVSHWQYKPYLLNGQPVEVETTITVTYSIGS